MFKTSVAGSKEEFRTLNSSHGSQPGSPNGSEIVQAVKAAERCLNHLSSQKLAA